MESANHREGGAPTYYLAIFGENFMKMKEIGPWASSRFLGSTIESGGKCVMSTSQVRHIF